LLDSADFPEAYIILARLSPAMSTFCPSAAVNTPKK